MKRRAEGERWFAQSGHDLGAAEVSLKGGYPEAACFLCQQAVEKGLKGYLYLQGEGPLIGHSTLTWVKACAGFDKRFKAFYEACRELDQFYIPARYPNGLPGGIPHDAFSPAQARRALRHGRAIRNLVAEAFEKGLSK